MSKASSFILNRLRQSPRITQNPNTQIRNLTTESKKPSIIVKECVENQKQCKQLLSNSISDSDLDIVKQVCKITRTMPRWEATLVSNFPSFNFSEPWFFRELLRRQENVFLSLRFFHWLRSEYQFSPDSESCNLLFDKLVEAKAGKAATEFLNQTGLDPEPCSLESYVRCLCENGLAEEAVDVFSILKNIGYHPSVETWNLALSACLKLGRTDLVWKYYQDMIDCSVGVNIDVQTVGCLIQAFCVDGKASKGFELLQQIIVDGLVPDTIVFHKLIGAFCKTGDYGRVSELLRTMISTDRAPDIYTYQEVISGLCKNRNWLEGFRIFNDIKDRGYAPDKVMYTTVIHGLCKTGRLGEARKLWLEMINKGMFPNEYTYNALLYGFYKVRDLKGAEILYKKMLEKGYGEMTVSYNTMIAGFCLHGKTGKAYHLFKEMSQKGIVRDLITFNSLILGFCKKGNVIKGIHVLHELLAQGFQPSTSSYSPIIENLSQSGNIKRAIKLLNDMQSRGLEPKAYTYDFVIFGLCKQGYVTEGMERFREMLKNGFKPKPKTLEKLVQCLSESDRFDDSFLVLDVMFRLGYSLKKSICHSIITKFCQRSAHLVESCLGEVLEIN